LVLNYQDKEDGFVKVDSVKIGVVGLGLVSSSHIKGYLSHPAAEVVAVCDLDEEQARRVARQFDIPKYYTSYDEMLTDTDINTIDIMTPTYLHRAMAVAAARAGKHIHCEKPLALTLAEGEQMCREAEEHDVALALDETYVFMATIVKARQLIDAGEIGKPQQIRERFGAWVDRPGVLDTVHGNGSGSEQWRGDSDKAGGNGFPWQFDHNVHFFATAQYLMNGSPVKTVYSLKADNSWLRDGSLHVGRGTVAPDNLYEVNTAEDVPLMTWTYEDPACQGVWMRAERLNGKYDFMTGFSATVIGDKGLIEVLGEGGGGLRWDGKPVHLVLHRDGQEPETFRFDDEGEDDIWDSEVSYYSKAHARRMLEFVDSLTGGRPSRYTGRDGLRDLRVAIGSICSAREGAPVEVREVTDSRFFGPGGS
jgi:predicted dehydrogenase